MAVDSEPLLAILLRAGTVLASASAGNRRSKTHMLRRVLLATAALAFAGGAGVCGLIAIWQAVDFRYGPLWAPIATGGVLLFASLVLAGAACVGRAPAPPVPPAPAPLDTLLDNLPPCVRQLAADPHLRLLVLSFLSGALAAKRPDKP